MTRARAGVNAPLAAHLEAARAAFLPLTETAEFAEGTAAFRETRAARLRGK